MATSGSTNYSINRDAILRQALLNLRKVDPALSVGSQDITDSAIVANLMIKEWQVDGLYLWLNQEVCLFQQYNTQSYDLGPSGDNCGLLSDSFKTQIASAASEDDSTITVDSDDNIADGDYIGIQLDDGTIQYTTVNGTPASDVVTLTAALTDDVAEDNYVFTYTNKISRPLKIVEARLRDTDDNDTPLNICTSRTEFFQHVDKTSTGSVLDVYYEPYATNGKLYTWPTCGTSDITDRIIMTIQRTIEDLDSSTDDFDGPVECLMAVIWCLSEALAPQYGIDIATGKGMSITLNAKKYYNRLKTFMTDREPFQMRP